MKTITQLIQKPDSLRDCYLWHHVLNKTDKDFFAEQKQWFSYQITQKLIGAYLPIEDFFRTALMQDGIQTQEYKVNGVSYISLVSKYFKVTYNPAKNSTKISLKSNIINLKDQDLNCFFQGYFFSYNYIKQLEDYIEEHVNYLYRLIFENYKQLYKDILLYRRIANKIEIEVTALQKKLPDFSYSDKFLIRFEDENIVFSIMYDDLRIQPKEYILPKYKWEEGAQKLIDDYDSKITKERNDTLFALQTIADRLLMLSQGKRCWRFCSEYVSSGSKNYFVDKLLSLLYPNKNRDNVYMWNKSKLFNLQYRTLEEYKQLLDREVGNFKSELTDNTLSVRFKLFKVNFVQRKDSICVTFKADPEVIKYLPNFTPFKREMKIKHEGLDIKVLLANNSRLNRLYAVAKKKEANLLNGYNQQQYINAIKTIVESFSCLIGEKNINGSYGCNSYISLSIPDPGKIRLYVCGYRLSTEKEFELSSFDIDFRVWLSRWVMTKLKEYKQAIKSIIE